MDQILTAALTLAGVTLAFFAVAYAIWRSRHSRPATAAPGRFPAAREYRLPNLSRRAATEPDDVEISPSRLARIRRQTPPEMVDESGYDTDSDAAPPLNTEPPAMLETALETLEELAIRGRQQFAEAGGGNFAYLPCLNADAPGMAMIEALVRRELAGWL